MLLYTQNLLLLLVDVIERDVDFLRLGVEPRGVTLGEGAADRVLTAQPHRELLGEKTAEGQELGQAPVHLLAVGDGLELSRESSLDLAVEAEALGNRGEGARHLHEILMGDSGVHRLV